MTTPTTQSEFFQANAIDGVLTPEQAAQLMELPEGDTSGQLENGGVPNAITATSNNPGDVQVPKDGTNNNGAQPNALDLDPANTVILAKDGKHTIGYEKLVEAREGEKHWKAQAEAAQSALATLQAQAQQRADTGQAATQVDNQAAAAQAAIAQGVDPEIFGDFSEEQLAAGIAKLVDMRVAASLDKALAPQRQKEATDATTSHYSAIYAAHPDADSVFESKELADWIGAQPSFVRDGYKAVLAKGSTEQIVELFDSFKESTGRTAAPNPDGGKGAAKAALATARAEPPASLSGIPGGRADGLSPQERMAGITDGGELYVAMENMTPAQIDAYLNKQL